MVAALLAVTSAAGTGSHAEVVLTSGSAAGRLAFLLVLRVRAVVVARAPARVELQVELLLFARHLVILGLLGAL